MTLSKLRFGKMPVGSLRRAHKLSNLTIDNLCWLRQSKIIFYHFRSNIILTTEKFYQAT